MIPAMRRHFTVSGFVVEGDATLLHWHPKLSMWLPPGGHIDPDEDMTEAVIREVLEETGIAAEIVPHVPLASFSNIPQLPVPLKIIVADIEGDPHQHIDMSYALRERAGVPRIEPERDHGFFWVTADQLRRNELLPATPHSAPFPIAEDVRVIGLQAIDVVRNAAQT